MIIRTSTGWHEELTDALGPEIAVEPLLFDREPSRLSQVLGPDGEPVKIDLPRRRAGFDLAPFFHTMEQS